MNHNIINIIIKKCDIGTIPKMGKTCCSIYTIVSNLINDPKSKIYLKIVIIKSIKNNVEIGMQEGAKYGYIDLVNYYIKRGAEDYKNALYISARYGRLEMTNYFMEKDIYDVNTVMYYASLGGQTELIKYLIKHYGASAWDLGYKGSIEGRHTELINFFRQKLNNVHPLFVPFNITRASKHNRASRIFRK